MLTNEELKNTTGGAIKYGVLVAVSGVVAFIAGIIDGYFRPLKCRK